MRIKDLQAGEFFVHKIPGVVMLIPLLLWAVTSRPSLPEALYSCHWNQQKDLAWTAS